MIQSLRLICLLLLIGLPVAAPAQEDPVLVARRAAAMLDQAGLALKDAKRARDRVAALTQTVKAFEEGLVALRDGVRRVSVREQALQTELDGRRAEISELLGVLVTLERDPETLLLLHPAGPLATVRSGMLLGEVTPALQARAQRLKADLDEAKLLRALQDAAAQSLQEGLKGAQDARTALSLAISDRRDLPVRFAEDSAALSSLLAGADTLEGFASGLSSLGDSGALPDGGTFRAGKGELPLPVQGSVLRAFSEADAAGIRRPGLVLATSPSALVTTPSAATVRYAGPLLDYGNVIILEPETNILLVLAGLDQVYGETGQVLASGAPVGLMGGADPQTQAFLQAATEGAGSSRTETLYIELRVDSAPEDPAPWFQATKE